MKNLKPCPCCGGAAHMITRPQIGNLSGDDGFLSTIKCLGGGDCGLEVSAWALKKAWAIESVTKKWNRRVNAEVPRWIPVTERLPDEGEYVLIWVGNVQVARIEKGISKQERALMKEGAFPDPIEYGWTSSLRRIGTKRSDCYRACDEDGNNKVPYKWYANGGPMAWFGQEVTHWMPLPDAPEVEG